MSISGVGQNRDQEKNQGRERDQERGQRREREEGREHGSVSSIPTYPEPGSSYLSLTQGTPGPTPYSGAPATTHYRESTGVRSERISRTDPAPTRTELGSGVRVELTSVIKHDRDISSYQDTGYQDRQVNRAKFTESRSTGRLPTHRSLTRLNIQNSANRLENRIIHKSMTRLDNRYLSNQGVSTNTHKGHYTQVNVPGAVSPTKSMSSGSVTGLERDMAGREILTVNINQITTDLGKYAGSYQKWRVQN